MNANNSKFSAQASEYLDRCNTGIWGWLKRREALLLRDHLDRKSFTGILDLGTGPGYYARYLQMRYKCPITAVDCSEEMLEQLRDPAIQTIHEDIETLSLPDRYDIVLLLGVLEFCSNPERAFMAAKKHLSTAGELIVYTNSDGLLGSLYHLHHRHGGYSIRSVSMSKLSHIAQRCDMRRTLIRRAGLVRMQVFSHA